MCMPGKGSDQKTKPTESLERDVQQVRGLIKKRQPSESLDRDEQQLRGRVKKTAN